MLTSNGGVERVSAEDSERDRATLVYETGRRSGRRKKKGGACSQAQTQEFPLVFNDAWRDCSIL